MKLTELAIDGNSSSRSVHLRHFDRGLNFVYGENGAGKSTLGAFVKQMLQLDDQHSIANAYRQIQPQLGSLTVTGANDFVLRRESTHPNVTRVDALPNGASTSNPMSLSQIIGPVEPATYNAVFNFSLRDVVNDRQALADILHHTLNVPTGPEAAAEDVNRAARQRQADERLNRYEHLRREIDARNIERSNLIAQVEAMNASRQAEEREITQQIDRLSAHINSLNPALTQTQLTAIERDIANLQAAIDHAETLAIPEPINQPVVDSFSAVYQRLDEVDQQIKRWRDVQSDIQNQRVRLKDEMVVWNEMTLESDEHPYHNAREILVGLEARVDQTEQTARRWAGTTASQIDVSQMASDVEEICKQMRDDLYGLCHELAHQYKHIRQRAAAVELKQLRRCYHEMGENTKRLVQRREQVISEIRSVDPAGADAIVRSDTPFCQCANHEGYLAARRRFLGEVRPPVTTASYQTARPDTTSEREKLAALVSQHSVLTLSINRGQSELTDLERQRIELMQRRERLPSSIETTSVNEKIRQLDSELHQLDTEFRALSAQIAAAGNESGVAPNPLLVAAGVLLERMSDGSLSQIFLTEATPGYTPGNSSFDLQVRDSIGKVHNFTGLDQASQDQVYLSLALATSETLRASSILLPIIIDDAFVHIGSDRVDGTLATLSDFSQRLDQQIFLLSQHRYLADRLPGLPVFELPPTQPETQPYRQPEPSPRSTPAYTPQVRPMRDPDLVASGIVANVLPPVSLPGAHPATNYTYQENNRPYPLSKYASNPAALVQDSIDSDFQLPWSPLNKSHSDHSIGSQHAPKPAVRVAAPSVHAFAADSPVASESNYETAFSATTSLGKLQLFDANRLNNLADCGVATIEQLLALDVDDLHVAFQDRGISVRQIERWQAQAWLLFAIPTLRADDARVLVACGITDPEHLETSHNGQVFERVQRFLSSPEGERYQRRSGGRDGYRLSMDNVDRWYRALERNRSCWSGRRSSFRRSRSSSTNRRDGRDYSNREPREQRARTYQVGDYPQRQRMSRPDDQSRVRAAAMAPRSNRSSQSTRSKESGEGRTTRASKTSQSKTETRLKFYLDLTDHIEAAPSIGPKTAERFEKIGVVTVADFLKQTAESMATRLEYKRITAEVVRTWQNQTRLVCRIPNLRGHDAQLLVACDVTEPEELSIMQPEKLFDIIGPFSDTKEGLKIIRSGKKPDLAEVTDWIQWAGHTRSLQAA